MSRSEESGSGCCEEFDCICGLCSVVIQVIPCCRYRGPKDKTYSDEDFRGTLLIALFQSLLCTPLLPCYLSSDSESPGQGLAARLATGIGFILYGFLFVILPFAFKVTNSTWNLAGVLYGSLLVLVGLFYMLTALRMRSKFKREAASKGVALPSGKTGERLIVSTRKPESASAADANLGPPPAYNAV